MSAPGPLQDDFNRYRRGDTKQVMSKAVDTATVVRIGDILFKDASDSNLPKAAADVGHITDDHASLAAAQEALHDEFLGVAMSRSLSGETNQVRVATGGVFEFDCAAAQFAKGALVGPALNGDSDGVENQKVVAVASANLAIGRVDEEYTANTETVLVRIVSTVLEGGPQAAA